MDKNSIAPVSENLSNEFWLLRTDQKVLKEIELSYESLSLSVSSERKPALFETADKYAYPVYPTTCFLAGKPRSGKTAYLHYAVKRWKNNEEAFGLLPVEEIHFCVITLDVITAFNDYNDLKEELFKQVITFFSTHRSCNVFFIDNFWEFFSCINMELDAMPQYV